MMSSLVIGNTIALKLSDFLEIFTEVFDGEKVVLWEQLLLPPGVGVAIQVASWLHLWLEYKHEYSRKFLKYGSFILSTNCERIKNTDW